MILDNNQQVEATIIGNVRNNKVGIDRDNIDFITLLLSTHLYSKPIQSFLRETVANGWDSHVEAGTTDIPIIVRVFKEENDIKLAIRDYGTGISPDRFKDIYLNIGSSTKRESNDYIGQMGIGRFSALSCSNMVNIKNYYKGTCYSYLMYKDVATLCIDELSQKPTDAGNGVEITITLCSYNHKNKALDSLISGLQQLVYFENLFVQDESHLLEPFNADEFNRRTVATYDTFKASSVQCYREVRAVMGNVIYPIDNCIISEYFKFDIPIDIICDMGTVSVTPNREELLYDEKTVNTLHANLAAARQEVFDKIVLPNKTIDFDTVEDWFYKLDYGTFMFKLLPNLYFSIPQLQLEECGITEDFFRINGEHIPKNLRYVYRVFSNINISPFIRHVVDGIPGKPTSTNALGRVEFSESNYMNMHLYIYTYRNFENRIFIAPQKFDKNAVRYIKESFWENRSCIVEHSVYLNPFTKKDLYRLVKYVFTNTSSCQHFENYTELVWYIIREFWSNYAQNIPIFDNSSVPAEKILEYQEEEIKPVRKPARKNVIYTLCPARGKEECYSINDVTTKSTLHTLQGLAAFKGKVFYGERGDLDLRKFYCLLYSHIHPRSNYNSFHYLFVEVAPSTMLHLEKFKNCKHINTLFEQKDNLIKKIMTAYYLYETYTPYCSNWYQKQDMILRIAGLSTIFDKLDKHVYTGRKIYTIQDPTMKLFTQKLSDLYRENKWLEYGIISDIQANPEIIPIREVITRATNIDIINDLAICNVLSAYKHQMAKQDIYKLVKNRYKALL